MAQKRTKSKRPKKLTPWENKEVLNAFIEASTQPEVLNYPLKDPLVALGWIVKNQKDVLSDGTTWDTPADFTSHDRYIQALKYCKTLDLKTALEKAWGSVI